MNKLEFKLPRYDEIPNVGLYLEQTVKYINQCIEPLNLEITASMLSNYVKQGYVERPVKKQYNADQIAHLIFIAIVKQTLSMQNIVNLFTLQEQTYEVSTAYNYFCDELEAMLENVYINQYSIDMTDMPFPKKTLTSVVIAISHSIYLGNCFKEINKEDTNDIKN